MAEARAALKAVDRVEITTLVDNSIDVFLPSTKEIRRAQVPSNLPWGERKSLVSEHGYSALVSVQTGEHSASLLFDAGVSTDALMHNMDVLEIRPQELHSIVLSHGHVDHTQGLLGMIKRLGKRRMPIVLHPDAFLNRKVILPDKHELHSPAPNRRLLEQENIEFVEERGCSYLLDGMVLVTGQIHRTTKFEKGFPIHYSEIDGTWQSDPLIHDDQALVVNVREKGLVVMNRLRSRGRDQFHSLCPKTHGRRKGLLDAWRAAPDRRCFRTDHCSNLGGFEGHCSTTCDAWTLHGLESHSRICTRVSRSVCARKCGHSLGH